MKTYNTNEIISLLLDKSKKNGATDTEVIISKSYGKSLEVRNNVKEKIEEFDTFNVGIRVFKGKKFSILSTNKIDEKSFDINKAVNCEIKSGHVSFHDTYLLHSSDANFSENPRKAIVLRYMPSTSLFDRTIPDRVSANGFKYEFNERPIFLVSGEAKDNELRNSNYI